jgi:NTE family protein
MSHKKLTIGLALGGGAARGIAHIGILQALEKASISIDYISGTSAGALVGALYASGVSSQEMYEFALNMKWTDIFSPHLTLRSFVSGKRLVKLLQKYCRVTRFENLKIPLSVVASDFETGKSISISEGELFPAVQASCSIPLICAPVSLNGRYYIDGGFAAELPVEAVRKMGADIVIACDVNSNAELMSKPGNFITSLKHLMRLVAKRNAETAKKQADIVIDVDIRGIGLMDFHQGRELVHRGRRATEAVLPEIEKAKSDR